MRPSCGPGKSTLAIGSPLASDFFDPQNCKTISSSIENESSLRPIKPVSRRTTANSNDNMMSRTSISDGATAPHIFSTIPLENATYMISRIDPRSAYPRTFLRSEEHTSELQSLMRISYAVFCLKKKTNHDPET